MSEGAHQAKDHSVIDTESIETIVAGLAAELVVVGRDSGTGSNPVGEGRDDPMTHWWSTDRSRTNIGGAMASASSDRATKA